MSVSSSILIVLANTVFHVVHYFFSKLLHLLYNRTSSTIPTITNSVLMESASSLAVRIRTKKVTSTEVVRAFIDRIKETNDVLNCVVHERFDEALKEAKMVDELIESGLKSLDEMESETPFLGVPFTTSECIGIKGLVNSAGVSCRKDVVSDKDADAVSRMREAGAIPIATTNVSRLCFSLDTNNSLFGRTCNPHDTNRSAGGLSGGEASLIASSGSPLGISSDSAGSIRVSSAFCGIFGHKPSAGACPTDRLYAEKSQMAFTVVGPMCKSSSDLLPALKIMAKKADLKLNEPVDLKALTYCFMEDDGGSWFGSSVDKEIKEALKKTRDHFQNVHKAKVKSVNLKGLKKAGLMWVSKMKNEPGGSLGTTGGSGKGKIKALREIVKNLWGASPHDLFLLVAILVEERLPPPDSATMTQLREECSELFKEFQDMLGPNGVFIYPTYPKAAFYHREALFEVFNLGYSGIFNVLGLPATHCPTGLNKEGLPVGFQIVGGPNQDRLTLGVANEIEKFFGGWKPPPTHGLFTLKKTVFLMSETKDKLS